MRVLLIHLALSAVWVALSGQSSATGALVGFALSYLVLLWMRPLLGETLYFTKLPAAISFAAFFVWELLLSNLRVAREVLVPSTRLQPRIVEVPLDATSDLEITLLANLITLTPGTLSLDVSFDRKVLFVHGMFAGDPEEFRRQIKDGFERRVLELLR